MMAAPDRGDPKAAVLQTRPVSRTLLPVLLALLVLGLSPTVATAKDFTFSKVAIDATVTPDGHMRIVEARTYKFDGQFRWATYRLPIVGTSGISEIRVADEKGAYAQSDSQRPGTFSVTREGEVLVIRWAFVAQDESRTFTISYLAEDVVTVYDDVAELYWKFIGTGWDRPSAEVSVKVRLPGGLRSDRIRVWGHGPLHGDARPVDGGAVLTVRGLPAATMVEGRVVFPTEVVPGTRNRKPGAALQRILREEGAWADEANRRRLVQRLLLVGLGTVPLLVIALWLFLYLRFGREPTPVPPEGYYRELPADYTPAELGVLWRFGSVQPADLVGTVLDLVRRGYLTVEPDISGDEASGKAALGDSGYTIKRTEKVGGLLPLEEGVLTLLFGSTGALGDSIAIERRGGLPKEVKARIASGYQKWVATVRRAADTYAFFDPASMKMQWVVLGSGILLVFGGWFEVVYSLAGTDAPGLLPVGLATMASGVLFALGSGAIRRRSQRGADDLRRWQGFRRFLLDFSTLRDAEPPAVALWEHYLVYAVPLGVADRVIAQLRTVYPAEELERSPGLRAWAGASSGGRGDALASFGGFATALAAATSSASSGSGGGGGFSGGGGRGGGGSGGSAG